VTDELKERKNPTMKKKSRERKPTLPDVGDKEQDNQGELRRGT